MIDELLSYYCNKRDISIPDKEDELKDVMLRMKQIGLLSESEIKLFMNMKGFNYESGTNQ